MPYFHSYIFKGGWEFFGMSLICVTPQSSELWKIPEEFPINRTGGKWRACSYELEQLCFFNWISGGSLYRKPYWALVFHACWGVWSAPICSFKGISLEPVLAFELIGDSGVHSAPLMQSELNMKKGKLKRYSSPNLNVSLWLQSVIHFCVTLINYKTKPQPPFLKQMQGRSFPRVHVNSILKEG